MSESAKALLGGAIFLFGMGTLAVWFAVGIPSTPLVWSMRIGLPLIVAAAIAGLVRAARKVDKAPDFFRLLGIRPFERDGVCVFITADAVDGYCRLNVLYQNQYANKADLRVVVQSPANNFFMTRREVAGLNVDVPVAGAEFGLVRVLLGIPLANQGQWTKLEVSAATRYGGGKGELLRFHNGLRAGRANASDLGRAASTAALLAIGVISIKKPASARIRLPASVSEQGPNESLPETTTIWRRGDPTEGGIERLKALLALNG